MSPRDEKFPSNKRIGKLAINIAQGEANFLWKKNKTSYITFLKFFHQKQQGSAISRIRLECQPQKEPITDMKQRKYRPTMKDGPMDTTEIFFFETGHTDLTNA